VNARATAILHADELQYFLPLPVVRRRVSYLLGRYAAKRALSAGLGNPAFTSINIVPGVFSNPIVCYPTGNPWQVSISHSDSLVCAIAFPTLHPMAVDVECVDPEKVPAMATQLSNTERAELVSQGMDVTTASTLLWTAKESLSKALCTGLMCPFEVFEVHSITRISPSEFEGLYRNLAQYKFRSWIYDTNILTITLPRRTEIVFDGGQPRIPSQSRAGATAVNPRPQP
jgi:phosphopantetheinyl transferase